MLKIGEFAALTGIPATSLRYYDKIGLLKPAINNTGNGYRYYAYQQLNQASRLISLRDLGFSLEELQKLLANQLSPGRIRQMLKERREAIQQRIRDDQQRLLVVENTLYDVEMDGRLSQHGVTLKSLPSELVLSHRFYAHSREVIDEQVDASREMLSRQARRAGHVRLIFHDLVYPLNKIDVEVVMPIKQKIEAVAPLSVRRLPEYPLVASVYHNGREGITRAWTDLRAWIDGNNYRVAGSFQEIILLDSPKGIVFELLFPIEKIIEGDTS